MLMPGRQVESCTSSGSDSSPPAASTAVPDDRFVACNTSKCQQARPTDVAPLPTLHAFSQELVRTCSGESAHAPPSVEAGISRMLWGTAAWLSRTTIRNLAAAPSPALSSLCSVGDFHIRNPGGSACNKS